MFRLLLLMVVAKASSSLAQPEGSSFSKMPFVKLDGNIIQAIAVPEIFQCCWKCDRSPECLSLNVADVPDKDGLYECQMLRTETNKYSGLLQPSQRYHHYTRVTDLCDVSKCLNGGSWENLGLNDFRCNCLQGFTGKLCDIHIKMHKWLKINTSPVCFGAKNSEYGSFYIKENGTVTTVKLVHLSGYVSCVNNNDARRSNWGCRGSERYHDFLNTVITNNTNQKLLPQDEFINDSRDFEYQIPGFTSMSPELIFKNFTTPMNVSAGQEYRIWYGQDLKKFDFNNEGTTCADVYMYGLF